MKIKYLTFCLLFSCFIYVPIFAQKYIEGIVFDADSGLPMPKAEVYFENTNIKHITDPSGKYKLEIPEKVSALKCIAPNCLPETFELEDSTKTHNFYLRPGIITYDTVPIFDPETYEEQVQVITYFNGVPTNQPSAGNNYPTAKPKPYIPQSGIASDAAPSLGTFTPSPSSDVSDSNTEDYSPITENNDKIVLDEPVSTFSIDVDNAAYSNIRRMINYGQSPPKNAVRIEEMINYFKYNYPQPQTGHPFSITTEIGDCPWNKERKLLHIGLQGLEADYGQLPPSNLVFLLDVSGSMNASNKLPLVKSAFRLLTKQLRPQDKVAIVVYAGAAGLVLPSTAANDTLAILQALDKLQAGGSTAGGAGINLAYQEAKKNFMPNGNNRVILATDGDFNIGLSSDAALTELIENKRKENIFLTVLGFGMGNFKDNKLELLANKGNGNYAYIDTQKEAEKMFVHDLRANLFTIAKDVKIQIEFNPAVVQTYRLVGYENRLLNREDFEDDTKDAGELGAGHSVTALYELVLANKTTAQKTEASLRYQNNSLTKIAKKSKELAFIQFRFKTPKKETSELIVQTIENQVKKWEDTSNNFQFAASVAGFGLLLTESDFSELKIETVQEMAKKALGGDEFGYRKAFLELVEQYRVLQK